VRGSSELVASGRRPAHHHSARRRPAWLLFFLLLPHSPRPCRIAPAHARTTCVLGRVTPCLHRPCTCACASAPPALTRLDPPCAPLLASGRSPPPGPRSCARTPAHATTRSGPPSTCTRRQLRTPARCCRLSQRAPGLARPRREPPAPRAVHAPAPPTRPPLQRRVSPARLRCAGSHAARQLPRRSPAQPPLARMHALALAPHVPQLRCLDSRQPE
jgi:hypothetical protein